MSTAIGWGLVGLVTTLLLPSFFKLSLLTPQSGAYFFSFSFFTFTFSSFSFFSFSFFSGYSGSSGGTAWAIAAPIVFGFFIFFCVAIFIRRRQRMRLQLRQRAVVQAVIIQEGVPQPVPMAMGSPVVAGGAIPMGTLLPQGGMQGGPDTRFIPTPQPPDMMSDSPRMVYGVGVTQEYVASTNIQGPTTTYYPLPGRTRTVLSHIRVVNYFEVEIIGLDSGTVLGVGFTTKPYPPHSMPGTQPNSIGYSSLGNCSFNDPGPGHPYGPGWLAGDVIGCGYREQNGQDAFFFTHNGKELNVVAVTHLLRGECYAAFGCNGGAQVRFNFLGPYRFATPPVGFMPMQQSHEDPFAAHKANIASSFNSAPVGHSGAPEPVVVPYSTPVGVGTVPVAPPAYQY